MKFGQLILRRIVKIVATKCQILRLKCTKIDVSWGFAPDPSGGAYSAPHHVYPAVVLVASSTWVVGLVLEHVVLYDGPVQRQLLQYSETA